MKQNTILIAVIVAIVAGGLGFYGGQTYQKSQGANAQLGGQMMGQNGQQMPGGARGGRFGGANGANRPVFGTIIAMDASSITVKMADGSSKIVDLTSKTTYQKSDTAALSDLKTGMTVAASGATNSDGSLTATNVALNPASRMMMGTPSPTAAQ